MKSLVRCFFISLVILSCQENSKKVTSPLSGIINENDDKSKIIEKLADSYLQGNFGIAKDYFEPDGKHYFNDLEYDVNGIIEGYNFHSVLYDDIKHIDPTVTTMYYNNGDVYTNQWSDWSGKSKITGDLYENSFHCWWQWEGDKIVSTKCYLDLTDIMKEAVLYQEKMAATDSN